MQDSTRAGKFTGSPPSSPFTPTANILPPNPNSSLARGRIRALKGKIALFASLTIQILLTVASVLSHSARRSETDRACCSCNTACTSHSQNTFCISTAFPVYRASCSSHRWCLGDEHLGEQKENDIKIHTKSRETRLTRLLKLHQHVLKRKITHCAVTEDDAII